MSTSLSYKNQISRCNSEKTMILNECTYKEEFVTKLIKAMF